MRRALAALGAAALLGGCGSGTGSDTSASTPAAAPARTVTVQETQIVGKSTPASDAGFDPATIYARDAPGVVTIISIYGAGAATAGGGAEGSGFVLNADGEIATNAHVVTQGEGSSIHKVSRVFVKFPDRNQVPARIIGFDPNEDVALLKVDPGGIALRPLQLGNSAGVEVGQPVAAIGSPFGEEGSLSVGIISALDRTLESLTQFNISGAIQTDAAINHGNSGGPLVDADGKVLGINAQINSSTGDNTGVGFAIPIDSVKRSLDELREKGRVDYAYLGVSSQSLYPQLAERLGLPFDHGAIIAEVVDGGPADRAGLRAGDDEIRFQSSLVPRGSDIVTKVDGREVKLDDDLGRILEGYDPGEEIELEVYRGDEQRTVKVKLGTRPSE